MEKNLDPDEAQIQSDWYYKENVIIIRMLEQHRADREYVDKRLNRCGPNCKCGRAKNANESDSLKESSKK
jgi:hypothetical protein